MPIPSIPKYSTDFFCIFSRFEFALKGAGFYTSRGNDRAKPDWRRFAQTASVNRLFQSLSRDHAIEYIFQHPPMQQVVVQRNGERLIEWQQRIAPVNSMDKLIDAVRQTRNNLFHGGKSAFEPIERAERNQRLISAATVVLLRMLEANNSVNEIFSREEDH